MIGHSMSNCRKLHGKEKLNDQPSSSPSSHHQPPLLNPPKPSVYVVVRSHRPHTNGVIVNESFVYCRLDPSASTSECPNNSSPQLVSQPEVQSCQPNPPTAAPNTVSQTADPLVSNPPSHVPPTVTNLVSINPITTSNTFGMLSNLPDADEDEPFIDASTQELQYESDGGENQTLKSH